MLYELYLKHTHTDTQKYMQKYTNTQTLLSYSTRIENSQNIKREKTKLHLLEC